MLFLAEKFREIVCAGDNYKAMVAALKAKGLLITQQGGKTSLA